jgi:mechanosensitive ion channel-like protein
MPTGTVQDWGYAVYLAVTTALSNFISAIPAIIGALVILAIGWILSNVLARVVDEVLERAGADRLFAEHGGREMYAQAGTAIVPSDVAAVLVKWVVRLIFLVAAANVLGLTQISSLLNQVILWIPNLIVAAVILLVAPLIGRFLRRLIEVGAGQMGFTNAPLLGRLVEVAVIAFAVVIAINQVGIAKDLVNILFIGVVGALSLAFGLAFGLGGREVAARLTEQWYSQSQDAAGRVREAAATSGAGGGGSAGGGRSAGGGGSVQPRSGTTPRPGMRSSVEPTTRRQGSRSELSSE